MKAFVLAVIFLMGLTFAASHQDEILAGKNLVDSNVSCNGLTNDQLELIGKYYMERAHPGQAHETMDRMMGGEGSTALKQAHMQMALVLYCEQTNITATYGGMIGMMPIMGRFSGGGGMMGNNMMNWNYGMSSYGGLGWVVDLAFSALILVGLILGIYWLYRNLQTTNSAITAITATEILKQRYAKGEITKKQFDEMRKDLE